MYQWPKLSCCDANGDQRLEVPAPQRRGLGLGEADVRASEGPDIAVAPLLRAGPLLRVVPILGLAHVRRPVALRVKPPATILHHDSVPCLHEPPRELQVAVGLIVVDGADQQRRKRPTGVGHVYVGGQPDPIPHGDLDVDTNLEWLRWFGVRQLGQPPL